MDAALQSESDRLARSWQRHETALLRDYLVSGVEDPRINVQSILTRHFLTSVLFGTRYQELMEAEIRFAIAMNWVTSRDQDGLDTDAWAALAAALASGADNAEGIDVPSVIHRIHASLPRAIAGHSIPNYLSQAIQARLSGGPGPGPAAPVLATFMQAWNVALNREPLPEPKPRLLEPACGSANDYRFLEAAGLARFFAYTGVDLSGKNVANARALFPHAAFVEGNVFQLRAADAAFDYAVVHDLFEHLSPDALEIAIAELCRVTGTGLCLGFFQVDEIDAHIIRPVDEYHVNTLSLARLIEAFARHGFRGEALHVGTFLRLRYGSGHTHNPNAYTLVLTRNLAPEASATS